MFTKQLYRYIFGKWENLSQQEIQAIPMFFKDHKHNRELRSAIYKLNPELGEKLYGDADGHFYYYVPDDDSIRKSFETADQHYHYFSGRNTEIIFQAYQSLYLFYELIKNAFSGYSYESVTFFTYKMLVMFGNEENIEKSFELFDAYCDKNKITDLSDIINTTLKDELRQNPLQSKIDLAAWRKILNEKGIEAGNKLFYIATEIEAILGRAPVNYAEAVSAAGIIVYKQAEQYPVLAAFCVANFVPEEIFDKCVSHDKNQRENAANSRYWIFNHLLENQQIEFVQAMPHQDMDLDELSHIASHLNAEGQFVFVNQFANELKSEIQDRDDFSASLKSVKEEKAQRRLIELLGNENVRNFTKNMFEFKYNLKNIHVNYRTDYVEKVIGKEKILLLVKSYCEYNDFLELINKSDKQVTYLANFFGKEKIQAFVESHCQVIDQLNRIQPKERYAYLTQLIGAEKLRSVLSENWCMLEAVLKVFDESEREKILFDVIGLDELRKIIPLGSDKRAIDAITPLLPVDQQTSLLDKLTTDEEKAAKIEVLKVKEKIIKTTFSLGLFGMGWSGGEIELDDGSKKSVPASVQKQWNYVKWAEKESVPFAEAWKEISKIGIEAANAPVYLTQPTTVLSYLTRATATTEYYQSFLPKDEKLDAVNVNILKQ
ncbi:MAG: hypothetical protein ACD_46C00218G0005 [uncultured bacterium]|nr:MAG: hypothetical protein ACD_46C00218G0005 [uncultured bacterium]